jgi:hypothetical protein
VTVWGARGMRDLEAWGPGIRLVRVLSYFDPPEPRQGMEGKFFRLLPIASQGAWVLHYHLGVKLV